MKRKNIRDYEAGLIERLKDREFATEYLNASLEDEGKGAEERFLIALRHVATAHGMIALARKTGMARQAMYRSERVRKAPYNAVSRFEFTRPLRGKLYVNLCPTVTSGIGLAP